MEGSFRLSRVTELFGSQLSLERELKKIENEQSPQRLLLILLKLQGASEPDTNRQI
jgi:hypothetical protein